MKISTSQKHIDGEALQKKPRQNNHGGTSISCPMTEPEPCAGNSLALGIQTQIFLRRISASLPARRIPRGQTAGRITGTSNRSKSENIVSSPSFQTLILVKHLDRILAEILRELPRLCAVCLGNSRFPASLSLQNPESVDAASSAQYIRYGSLGATDSGAGAVPDVISADLSRRLYLSASYTYKRITAAK